MSINSGLPSEISSFRNKLLLYGSVQILYRVATESLKDLKKSQLVRFQRKSYTCVCKSYFCLISFGLSVATLY